MKHREKFDQIIRQAISELPDNFTTADTIWFAAIAGGLQVRLCEGPGQQLQRAVGEHPSLSQVGTLYAQSAQRLHHARDTIFGATSIQLAPEHPLERWLCASPRSKWLSRR
jgi:hypothetical protein